MNKIFNSLAFLLFTQYVFAQSSVISVLNNVLKNNKTLKASTQFMEAKKLEYKTGLNPSNPRVDYDFLIGSPAGAGNQQDFSISQAFDFPTAYISRNKISNEQIAKTNLELIALRQNVLLETKILCIQLTYLNKQKNELVRRITQVQQIYQAYQLKFKNGEATSIDVNKAQLMLLNLTTELQLNRSEFNNYSFKLSELNGGVALNIPDTVYAELPSVPDFETLDSLIEKNDIVVKICEKDKDIAQIQLRLAKNLLLPKLETGYHSQSLLGQKYQGAHVGITLPLWENKNTLHKQKAFVTYNDFKVEEHRNEHYFENKQLYEKHLVLKTMLEEYNKIFNNNNNAQLLTKSLQTGNISSIEYFMELTYYYVAFDNYLKKEKDYHLVVTELFKYEL